MSDKLPLAAGGSNRRENFRIDCVMPISIRKIGNGVVPTARIFAVAANTPTTGGREGGATPSIGEFDSNFALMLIEVNAKLDLLLSAQHLKVDEAIESGSARLSMNQLLLQINLKLEYLLGAAHNLIRPEERTKVVTVSISASGIKLVTEEVLAAGDLVEVRMLLSLGTSFWVVIGGSVVRATMLPTGKHEVAINFLNMSETVEDEISRYALTNQKKQLLARRGM